jgi:hypothetical protein
MLACETQGMDEGAKEKGTGALSGVGKGKEESGTG